MRANYSVYFFALLLLAGFLACKSDGGAPSENAQSDTSKIEDPAVVSEAKREVVIPEGFMKINWDELANVKFEVQYFEEAEDSLLFPVFGENVKALASQPVAISGYVIPVTYDRYVISANPFSQCFFCGNAGPESVMELAIEDLDGVLFHTDEFRTFTGRLKLNDADVNQLNYILEGAQAL